MLPSGATGAGRLEHEFVRGDGQLRGHAQRAAQGVVFGEGPWHEGGAAGAIDFAVMQLPQDNLPLGERLARRWLDDWRGAAVLVALLALASSITGLVNGFAYDDLPLIVDTDRLKDWRQLWRVFGQSYWGTPTAPQDLYRPLILGWYGVQWAVGGGNPLLFHIFNIVVYVAVSILLVLCLRYVTGPRAAGIGAAVWAVHPVHVEPVGNVVGQAELVTAFVILLGLLLYLRARLVAGLTRGTVIGLVVLYPVGLLVKEHAILFPMLLATTELTLWVSGTRWRSREQPLAGLLARLLVYETALYLFLRWWVLPSLDSVPHYVLAGLSDWERVLVAAGFWPEILRLMVWPARLYADYSPQLVTVHTTWHPIHGVAAVLLCLWITGALWGWRARRAAILLGFLWFPLTFALVSNLLFPTGILIAERTLFVPSISLAFLVAGVMQVGLGSSRVRGGIWVAGFTPLLLFGVLRSSQRQRTWTDSITVFSTMVSDAPNNARSLVMLGNLFLRGGALDRATTYFERAYALHPTLGQGYARVLQKSGRCPQALEVVEQVATSDLLTEDVQITRISCLLELRRFSEARRRSTESLARGGQYAVFHRSLMVADSLLASTDTVESRNLWIRAKLPFDRTNARLTVNLIEPRIALNPVMFDGGRVQR